MQDVKIKSSDGLELVLTTEVAFRSKKIKETFKQQGFKGPVILSEVNGYMLEKVVDWMTKYKDGSVFDDGIDNERKGNKFNDWDVEYLKMERETLFALARAAYAMEVRGLVNYCARTIAELMMNLTAAQVRGFIGLPRLNSKAHHRYHGS